MSGAWMPLMVVVKGVTLVSFMRAELVALLWLRNHAADPQTSFIVSHKCSQ